MCRSEYRGGFRRGLLMSHGTDSVRTNLAGSVGAKTAIWEFKYHLGFRLLFQDPRVRIPPQRPTPTRRLEGNSLKTTPVTSQE